jgi:hypothetical protein
MRVNFEAIIGQQKSKGLNSKIKAFLRHDEHLKRNWDNSFV